jgi:hypothetical protein
MAAKKFAETAIYRTSRNKYSFGVHTTAAVACLSRCRKSNCSPTAIHLQGAISSARGSCGALRKIQLARENGCNTHKDILRCTVITERQVGEGERGASRKFAKKLSPDVGLSQMRCNAPKFKPCLSGLSRPCNRIYRVYSIHVSKV